MTRNRLAGGLLALAVGLLFTSCGGSGSEPLPPGPGPNFTRLTATVTDATGAAMPGLSVRVDGQSTGVTTDASGSFELSRSAFPNGVDRNVEIALGKGGIVLGTRELIPANTPALQIRFGETGAVGTSSVSGTVYNGSQAYPTANRPGGDALFAPEVLANVEVTLFNAAAGAVFQTKTGTDGRYAFNGVASGTWQMSAQLDGYHPEMAAVRVEDNANSIYDFALLAKGAIDPGAGVLVSGVLRNSATNAPIAGATINLYADTGYYHPLPIDIMPVAPMPGVPEPDFGPTTGKETRMMPEYRPQYQTTTTAADGSYSFPEEVAGYSLWMDYSAPDYLAGTHYQDINGRTGELKIDLELTPLVATGVRGRVVNGSGQPVKGARVEFIFGSGMGGGVAIPGFTNVQDMANQGNANFDGIGAPPPPRAEPPSSPGAPDGWDDEASAPQAGGGAASPGNSNGGGSNFNNPLMQRFLWEQQQKGGSAVPADFSGYVAVYTDANGEYTIANIPAGPYYVMASAYRHLPFAGDAELGADEETNVFDVTLPVVPVGSVEGTVIGEDGNPIGDVLVNATQPNVDPFTFTDASGAYRIDNVPAGEWLISAFKSGYYTASQTTQISEDGVVKINLQLRRYEGPDSTTISYSGRVINGYDNSNVGGADIVFTPIEEHLGGYARHIVSGANGSYTTQLVPNTEYNVLIQRSGYEDIFFRFWMDQSNPRMDFWLWPIGAPGGSGGWNGGNERPPMPGGDPGIGWDDAPVASN